MSASIQIKTTWDTRALRARLSRQQKAALLASGDEFKKDSNAIAPQDQSILIDTSVVEVKGSQVAVKYVQPYARRLHDHPEFNFSKDKNPRAQGEYLRAALLRNYRKYQRIQKMMLSRAFIGRG